MHYMNRQVHTEQREGTRLNSFRFFFLLFFVNPHLPTMCVLSSVQLWAAHDTQLEYKGQKTTSGTNSNRVYDLFFYHVCVNLWPSPFWVLLRHCLPSHCWKNVTWAPCVQPLSGSGDLNSHGCMSSPFTQWPNFLSWEFLLSPCMYCFHKFYSVVSPLSYH